MSRYTFTQHQFHVTVGWDNPLSTFFAQVHNTNIPMGQPRLVRWVGTEPHALPTTTALVQALADVVDIPTHLLQAMQADQTASAPPTSLQRDVRKLMAGRVGLKRFLAGLALLVVVGLQATPAWAACTTHTYMYNGQFVTCTTCCVGNMCNTTCY